MDKIEHIEDDGKLYTIKAICFGTFLGGPLVGGYLISENYKTLKMSYHLKMTYIYTIIIFFVLLNITWYLFPRMQNTLIFVPLFYTTMACIVSNKLQKTYINNYKQLGVKFHNWYNIILPIIISLIIFFIFSLIIIVHFNINVH